jgi:hypothetical protein
MEVVVPWQELIDLIEPHYSKTSKKAAGHRTHWRRCCGSI